MVLMKRLALGIYCSYIYVYNIVINISFLFCLFLVSISKDDHAASNVATPTRVGGTSSMPDPRRFPDSLQTIIDRL